MVSNQSHATMFHKKLLKIKSSKKSAIIDRYFGALFIYLFIYSFIYLNIYHIQFLQFVVCCIFNGKGIKELKKKLYGPTYALSNPNTQKICFKFDVSQAV